MLRRFHWLPLLFLFVGFVASLATLTQRYGVEARSRAVSLVLDHADLRGLASATGVPLPEAYRRFKAAGITGIALTEDTLAGLELDGLLRVRAVERPDGREYVVEGLPPELAEQVGDHVSRLVGGATEQPIAGDRVSFPGFGGGRIYVLGRWEDVRGTPVGIDPLTAGEVRAAGLEPIARVYNPPGLTAPSLQWKLWRAKQLGATTFIFAGDEVLGFRGLIEETARLFEDMGLLYGTIELGKQRGDAGLSARLEERLVRVHSISPAEMARITPEDAIERYVRAAVERNIRLNYVRLPDAVTKQTFADSVDYVQRLSRQTVRAGFGLGAPIPFTQVWESAGLRALFGGLIGLGIAAGAALLLAGVFVLSRTQQAVAAALLGLGGAALGAAPVHLGPELMALTGAIVFPTLAFVLFPQPLGAFEEHEHAAVRERTEAVVPAVAEFAAISLVTLVGALMVAAQLSELSYLVKTEQFVGIKAATALPLLLVGAIYLTGLTGLYPSLSEEGRSVTARLRGFFSEPVRVWHAVAILVGIVALALLLARSGNDPGVGVSELELRFRSLLDRVVGVRPRTKEFLIGHPALLLSLAMAARPQWRLWALPLLLVGIIGQVGMLNSFCHLHSPLKVTLLRTLNGLWTGGLLGILLVVVWQWLSAPVRPWAGALRR